ncbi:hypothetical protein V9T40_013835 [Parthenolecanium corni]|uniref:Phosphodiesterase n=1 Tax=Parthenolecanium corni TaxID=536013 RepID=A0AAN9TBW3_9HEMI
MGDSSLVPDLDPQAVERWIVEKASADFLEHVLRQRQQCNESSNYLEEMPTHNKRTSITSEIFNSWISASPSKTPSPKNNHTPSNVPRSSGEWKRQMILLDEADLFMELIRDVSNELDIDMLCYKILLNVGLLTRADRGSLFLAKGPPDNKYLAAKLFDVTVDTEFDVAMEKAKSEEIRIPFGVGVAGTVAQTKQLMNIQNAYDDPRFNSNIDNRTGYKTSSILCVPISNYEGEVIGVAQIINKTDGSDAFTEHDVQMLLSLARSIFEEQNNLECLVTKIMTQARDLLKCERCAVFLLDLNCCEASHLKKIEERPKKHIKEYKPICKRKDSVVNIQEIFDYAKEDIQFPTLFELGSNTNDDLVSYYNNQERKDSRLVQIAKYVASTGQVVNIENVTPWVSETEDDLLVHCILCMPILNGQKKLIGVAQLINKENKQPFIESDISIFEAFAIFCGLGIHNTQMYENACKLMAKQKVALECLSYHATATLEDTNKLAQDVIPSAETYNLYSFKFIDFDLTDDDTCKAAIRMFLECSLVQKFQIPYQVLCKWILSVKKNYRPVKYHNWRHALNVAQTMFAMLKTAKMEQFMNDLEILGLLVACLCHDLDHRGTNNAFQSKIESPLAILYTTSTMEHHHFDQCVMILNSDGNNIFQALSPEDYRAVMKIVENSILSTDLAMYFKKKNRFMELVENGEFDWQSEEKKELLCGILMSACDVSAIAKPWDIQHKMAKLVADEFFDQGDLEKLQLNEQPVAMMDRERKDELPQMQVGFIDLICLPLYKVLAETFPWMQPLYDGTLENRKHWQDLAEKVEMGLTWIDHDVIEKPVEEFSVIHKKDIEFTVTTLNCQQSLNRRFPDKQHLNLDLDTTSTQTLNSNYSNGSTPIMGITRFTSFRRIKSYNKAPKVRSHHSFHKEHKSSFNSPKLEKAKTFSLDKVSSASQTLAPLERATSNVSAPKSKNKVCSIM